MNPTPTISEAARRAAQEIYNAPIFTGTLGLKEILIHHFAPVYAALTERDERIKQLETDNDTLRAAQKACEDCMTPTYATLRTRCEELQRDKERLEATVGELRQSAASVEHNWEQTSRVIQQLRSLGNVNEHIKRMLRSAHDNMISPIAGLQRAARKEGQQAHEKGEGTL